MLEDQPAVTVSQFHCETDLYAFSDMTDKMATTKKTLTQTVLADGRIELSGPTFEVREAIKAAAVAAGGKAVWDGGRRVWIVPAGTVVPSPAKKPAVAPRPREEWTRDEWQAWSADFKRRNCGRVERCCSGARWVGDPYGPMVYACERHGETRGDYRGD